MRWMRDISGENEREREKGEEETRVTRGREGGRSESRERKGLPARARVLRGIGLNDARERGAEREREQRARNG